MAKRQGGNSAAIGGVNGKTQQQQPARSDGDQPAANQPVGGLGEPKANAAGNLEGAANHSDPAKQTGGVGNEANGINSIPPAEKNRGRGRPAGSPNKNATPLGVNKLDADKLSKTIFGVHAFLATALKQPVMVISMDEAKLLAEASVDVMKFYNLPIDPKMLAWFNLVGAAGFIYAPRVFKIMASPKKPPPAQNSGGGSQQSPPRPQPDNSGTGNAVIFPTGQPLSAVTDVPEEQQLTTRKLNLG